MRKLNVGAPDNFNGFHDCIRMLLQAFLKVFGDGKHRRTKGIAGVDTHGIHVFNDSNSDHLILRIPDHFQFQFFPAQYGFFDEYLVDNAGR